MGNFSQALHETGLKVPHFLVSQQQPIVADPFTFSCGGVDGWGVQSHFHLNPTLVEVELGI